MAVATRNRSVGTALRYRGREGMWTWFLHRLTGLGILAFLLIHVVDTALVIYWPAVYDASLDIYRHPLFRVSELAIFFAVIFHSMNGLRIVVQDFWPAAMLRQRQLAYAAAAITAVAMIPVTWIMIAPLFGWAEEPGTERHRARMQERGAQVEAAPASTPSPVSLEEEAP